MSGRLPGKTQADRVLAAIAKGMSCVAQIRVACDLTSATAARACTELRGQGLIIRTDPQPVRGRPARWELTPEGAKRAGPSFELNPNRAHQHGRPITEADLDGRARLLSDGCTFSMGKWDGFKWVYARSTIPLDITPTEVLL